MTCKLGSHGPPSRAPSGARRARRRAAAGAAGPAAVVAGSGRCGGDRRTARGSRCSPPPRCSERRGLAEARLTALDAGRLAAMHGDTVESRAVLLEPVRVRAAGRAVARVRLLDGPGAGEQAVLRARDGRSRRAVPRRPPERRRGRWRAATAVLGGAARASGAAAGAAAGAARHRHAAARRSATSSSSRGAVGPLGRFDAYSAAAQRARRDRRRAVWCPPATAAAALAGALDSVRRRGERGLARGLAPPEAALLRGMVLGQDERLSEDVRDAFERSGLAHILAVSGQNVMLLAALVLGVCALLGIPLRSRLILAGVLIAVYVPLAGGGPSIQRAGRYGRGRARGGARRATGPALVRAAAGRGGHARAQPARGRRARAGSCRSRRSPRFGRRRACAHALERRMPRAVAEAAAITIAATVGDRAVDGALLPAGFARRAAREPARRACDRAGDVARRARHRRGADRRAAGRAVHRARRSAARLHPASRRGSRPAPRCRS